MNKRNFVVTVFLGVTILTLLTNYISFNTISLSKTVDFTSTDSEMIEPKPSEPFKSPWLEYRLTDIEKLSYYSNKNSSNYLKLINCTQEKDVRREATITKHTSYTFVTNFVISERELNCEDPFVTFATHGDFRFLDNVVPVVERWQGPVSVALYIPKTDVYPTVDAIAYLRECTSPLVKEWVTFHLFTETKFLIEPMPSWTDYANSVNCSKVPKFSDKMPTARQVPPKPGAKQILYPVNVARNIARATSQTYYVLVADLELYPSPNFIPTFFEMLDREAAFFQNRTAPYVLVLPIFEMAEDYEIPNSRLELMEYVNENISVTFHKYVCEQCHLVPRYEDWLAINVTENELNVFHIAKREVPFIDWEPIFISTNDIPLYDERLSWEGRRDKMAQSYMMCILDFDFMILDNAFLMHKPGIKIKKFVLRVKPPYATRRQDRILRKIQKEITKVYGKREKCNSVF